jgi:hypothetical protein
MGSIPVRVTKKLLIEKSGAFFFLIFLHNKPRRIHAGSGGVFNIL